MARRERYSLKETLEKLFESDSCETDDSETDDMTLTSICCTVEECRVLHSDFFSCVLSCESVILYHECYGT